MGRSCCGIFFLALALAAPVLAQPTATSLFGNVRPAYTVGMKPSTLGWGADDQAYPDRCIVNAADGAELVWVPAATFPMGMSAAERDRIWRESGWTNEWKYTVADGPVHLVTLTKGYWLYRYPVTVGQYFRFLEQAGDANTPVAAPYRERPLVPAYASWSDGYAYCQWAAAQLVTEAQREWAARGPKGWLYPWGNSWDRTRCNSGDGWAQEPLNDMATWKRWFDALPQETYPLHLKDVGSMPNRSWCGADDLAGNTWEWCWDWYDGTTAYSAGLQTDPQGPPGGTRRAIRGGGWVDLSHNCLSVYRTARPPTLASGVGFRPVIVP
jgi:formylglycine-generating enzyme required for sulfatase activity